MGLATFINQIFVARNWLLHSKITLIYIQKHMIRRVA